MIHFRIRSERIQTRTIEIRRKVALIRAVWLGLLAPSIHVFLTMALPAYQISIVPSLLIGATVLLGMNLYGRRKRVESAVVAELDRRFGLGDLLVTAAEVDRRGARSVLDRRLLEDGAAAIAGLGGERAISDAPVRLEWEALFGVSLLLLGSFAVREASWAPLDPDKLPPISLASSNAGSGETMGSGPVSAGDRTAGLEGLASAFGSMAAGAEAAEALGRGDARAAARALRALADRAPELSTDGRETLSEALGFAAEKMSDASSDLAQAARNAAEALEADDDSSSEGLADLASALDAVAGRSDPAAEAPEVLETNGPNLERLEVRGERIDQLGDESAGGQIGRSAAGRGGDRAEGGSGDGGRSAGSGATEGRSSAGSGDISANFGADVDPRSRTVLRRYFAAEGSESP